jgi:hypothetical protein
MFSGFFLGISMHPHAYMCVYMYVVSTDIFKNVAVDRLCDASLRQFVLCYSMTHQQVLASSETYTS